MNPILFLLYRQLNTAVKRWIYPYLHHRQVISYAQNYYMYKSGTPLIKEGETS